MDVLILMAGQGSRFHSISSDIPKPLIELHGHPIVRWVVKNLTFEPNQRFLFVCLKDHVQKFDLHNLFKGWNINFEIVEVDHITQGATCSALLAKNYFYNQELIIANSDQFLIFDKDKFLQSARNDTDATIMSMNAFGNKWSYLRADSNELVIEVKEKVEISSIGTTGVYYFKNGELFSNAAEEMIRENDRFNNEFYLAPSYNYLIKNNFKVSHFNIGDIQTSMFGLGTAEDYLQFKNNPKSIEFKNELFND